VPADGKHTARKQMAGSFEGLDRGAVHLEGTIRKQIERSSNRNGYQSEK
jgi:hypothetical protein